MALYNVGSMYFDGEGVEKNLDSAIEYFKLSEEKGLSLSFFSPLHTHTEREREEERERERDTHTHIHTHTHSLTHTQTNNHTHTHIYTHTPLYLLSHSLKVMKTLSVLFLNHILNT